MPAPEQNAETESRTETIPAALPLTGIRVIDLTRVMTGPYCTMMLGDLGADVVKVEMPGRGDDTRLWGPPFVAGESTYFMSVNRNKRSVALDLKSDGGKAALWKLLDGADVLVENFSPGTLARLGFGDVAVRERVPRLVYASISGFGQMGPDHDRVAYDLIVQGMSGMMSITGHPGGLPTRLGVPIADIGAGMFAAYAIASALLRREKTGEGCRIDTSMLGGQVALLTYQAANYFHTGNNPPMLGNGHPNIAPYDTFACADGHVNVSVGNDAMWLRFCDAIGRPELKDHETFRTNAGRVTNKPDLYATLQPTLDTLTRAELLRRLDEASVPSGPIQTLGDVLEDPQVLSQSLLLEIEHPAAGPMKATGGPYHFDGEAVSARRPAPLLGEQTREILAEAGFSEEEIAGMIASGAAAEPA